MTSTMQPPALGDIQTEADIQLLVNSFYDSVRQDEPLRHLFEDVAQVDWETHLPKLYAFWSALLLGTSNFHGNTLFAHIKLNQQHRLEPKHFDRWLHLFEKTVFGHFSGPKALEAMARARHIAGVIRHRLGVDQGPGLLSTTPLN